MLSRRGIRIKVMQVLFSLNRDKEFTYKEASKRYWNSIDEAFNLYLFNLYILVEITRESLVDAKKRKSKHLPSDEDKTFSAKIYQNDLITSVEKDDKLQKTFKKLGFPDMVNKDYCKKIYQEYSESEAYHNYLAKASTNEDHLDILLDLYRMCRKHEFFVELMDDNFINWVDDKSVVIGTMKKNLKELAKENPEMYDNYYPDEDTTKTFGYLLLDKTYQDDEELLKIIKPSLKNWDHERLAVIDMILLKMALTEFVHCKTIPTKVTLNEYVEVSKLYSTPKSKDFINGVLDRLLKEMEESGKIVKEGRGLVN